MKYRENYLRTVRFERPEYIPVEFHINAACWQNYPQEALFDLMDSHKLLFPNFKRLQGKYIPSFSNNACKDIPFIDDFGCLWETTENGIVGTVTRHPLAEWDAFEDYKAPDPNICMGIGPIDWDAVELDISERRSKGELE